MNLVGAVRVYVFYRLGATHRPIWVLGLIVALVVLAGIATWQTWTSILPIFGIIVAVFAFWQLNEQRLRVLLLVAAPLWIAYNVLHGSYPGIINELLLIVSSLIALWRYRKLGLS